MNTGVLVMRRWFVLMRRLWRLGLRVMLSTLCVFVIVWSVDVGRGLSRAQQLTAGPRQNRPQTIVATVPKRSQAEREDKRTVAALGHIEDLYELGADSEKDIPRTRNIRTSKMDQNQPDGNGGDGGERVVPQWCKASASLAAISRRVNWSCAGVVVYRRVRRGDVGAL